MRILIHGINFLPELTGIGKYSGELAEWLAAQGHEVRVVTAPPYYPQWKLAEGFVNGWSREAWTQRLGLLCQGRNHSSERWNVTSAGPLHNDGGGELTVFRCPLWVPSRLSGLRRIVHLASFAVSSFPVMLQQVFWQPDVVWVVEPPLFCAPQALLVAQLAGAKRWLHIQDFEVDAAFDLGLLKGVKLRRLVSVYERWLMRSFDNVSTISQRMLDHAVAKGVKAERVVLFPNWVNTEVIRPLGIKAGGGGRPMVAANHYRTELKIATDAIIALYSGNMGDKQGLEVLIQAAAATLGRKNLVWVFCGDGFGRSNLERGCNGLPNVRFMPLQPVEQLNELLNLADIHLLPQRADIADLVMPSKLMGMLASGRPVVATAQAGTQVYSVCVHCGLVVSPGDSIAFAEAVISLADDAPLRSDLGLAARAYAELHFSHDTILSRFESELQLLIKKS